jgi:hypothetical protein
MQKINRNELAKSTIAGGCCKTSCCTKKAAAPAPAPAPLKSVAPSRA